jgi:hypothetical protein
MRDSDPAGQVFIFCWALWGKAVVRMAATPAVPSGSQRLKGPAYA